MCDYANKPLPVSIDYDLVEEMQSLCEVSIENAHELLEQALAQYPEGTKKCRVLREAYGADIRRLELLRERLRGVLGWASKETCDECNKPVTHKSHDAAGELHQFCQEHWDLHTSMFRKE